MTDRINEALAGLKPCPHCGKYPSGNVLYDPDGNCTEATLMCLFCDYEQHVDLNDVPDEDEKLNKIRELVEAWNNG